VSTSLMVAVLLPPRPTGLGCLQQWVWAPWSSPPVGGAGRPGSDHSGATRPCPLVESVGQCHVVQWRSTAAKRPTGHLEDLPALAEEILFDRERLGGRRAGLGSVDPQSTLDAIAAKNAREPELAPLCPPPRVVLGNTNHAPRTMPSCPRQNRETAPDCPRCE